MTLADEFADSITAARNKRAGITVTGTIARAAEDARTSHAGEQPREDGTDEHAAVRDLRTAHCVEDWFGRFCIDAVAQQGADEEHLRKGVVSAGPDPMLDPITGELVPTVVLLRARAGRVERLIVPCDQVEALEVDQAQIAGLVRTFGKQLWDVKGRSRWRLSDDERAVLGVLNHLVARLGV